MKKEQSHNDIQAIRNIMEESSRFLSLSGLSGIFPGIFAIIGAAFAYFVILQSGNQYYDEYLSSLSSTATFKIWIQLSLTGFIVLVASLGAGWYFSWNKAKKMGKRLWTSSFKRLLFHLLLPLLVGGIFCLLLTYHNNISLVASAMLIFYGLALINGGKYTFHEIHYLGLCEITLGILAGIFIHYGIIFWTLGFGVLHIVYGTIMYIRHK